MGDGTMRVRKQLLLWGLVILTIVSCTGQHPAHSKLVGRQYVSKQDLLLCDWGGDSGYAFRVAGTASDIPLSIAEYRRYGDEWDRSPEFVRRNGRGDHLAKSKVIRVVPAGTEIEISKVTYRNNSDGYSAIVWAKQIGETDDMFIDVDSVFLDLWGKDADE